MGIIPTSTDGASQPVLERCMEARRAVLVVEDEPLIAMGLEAELADAGYEVSGPASTCAEALALIAHQRPDCALLDVQLADGKCIDLARALAKAGVPFVVTTGLRAQDLEEPLLRDAPCVHKPFEPEAIVFELRRILAAAAA